MTEYPADLMRDPAATMRRAAARMQERADMGDFWRAMADWLQFEAVSAPEEGGVYLRGGRIAYALAVACAYLTSEAGA